MQSEHVAVGIDGQRDEALLANRELGFEDAAAGAKDASGLDRAVVGGSPEGDGQSPGVCAP